MHHSTSHGSIIMQSSTNGQAETCITFIKRTMTKCYETNIDSYMLLLHIRSTLISPGLPSSATLLFNRPTRSMPSKLNRSPILLIIMRITSLPLQTDNAKLMKM